MHFITGYFFKLYINNAYIIVVRRCSQNNPEACNPLIEDNIDFSFYKTLFNPVRIEILLYLVSHGKKNIKEITENFSQDRSVISRHLDLMYRFHIVTKTKENRSVFYKADSNFVIEKFGQTSDNIKKLLALSSPNKYVSKTQ